MNKIISIFAILLFSTGAYAAGCDNGSLKGRYGYEVSGVNEIPLPPDFKITGLRSTHVVGQAFFDGKGHFDVTGYGSAAGSFAERHNLTQGTYTVNSADCTATGSLTWNTGETSEFHIVLANTSDEHSAKKAYHASVLVSTDGKTALPVAYPSSASGTLTRLNGKFN